MKRTLIELTLLLAVATQAVAPQIASAYFKFCNKTNEEVEINFVRPDAYNCGTNQWGGYGWYHADPNECVTVYGSGLGNRYYYYYAESVDNRYIWSGSSQSYFMPYAAHTPHCANVGSTGYNGDYYGHRIVDTGNYTNYTLNLTSSKPCSAWNCYTNSYGGCSCGY